MSYIPSVLLYICRGDEVLLMHRNKEPNLGLWVAPGGKVEDGESPYETARREILEETGLTVGPLQMRGFCTEVSPDPDWMWFLFVFVTRVYDGTLTPDLREGRLAWVSKSDYFSKLPIPQADAIFAPRVLAMEDGLFQAKFVYDEALTLVDWTVFPDRDA